MLICSRPKILIETKKLIYHQHLREQCFEDISIFIILKHEALTKKSGQKYHFFFGALLMISEQLCSDFMFFMVSH